VGSQWWIEAEIHVGKGDRDSTIAAYEKILAPVSFLVHRHFVSAAYPILFHYELARLPEEAGRTHEARAH
jgi:hypothetical protein